MKITVIVIAPIRGWDALGNKQTSSYCCCFVMFCKLKKWAKHLSIFENSVTAGQLVQNGGLLGYLQRKWLNKDNLIWLFMLCCTKPEQPPVCASFTKGRDGNRMQYEQKAPVKRKYDALGNFLPGPAFCANFTLAINTVLWRNCLPHSWFIYHCPRSGWPTEITAQTH